jgi:hypothetical protein
METNSNDRNTQLFDYLDGTMSLEERKQFERALSDSSDLQKQVDEQRLWESSLRILKLEEPSQAFAQNVMSKIGQSSQGPSLSIRHGIFLLIGVVVVSLIASLLVQAGVFDVTGNLPAPTDIGGLSNYIKQPIPSFSIPINGKIIVNGIILLNMAIGFILLDRAVLRPFFERRMRHS